MNSVMNRTLLRNAILLLACVAGSGCVSQQVKRVNQVQASHAEQDVPAAELLDVEVTRFDPGVPASVKDQQKENILPSVREAEANYFPQALRQTLDSTGYWGSVRVLPEVTPAAEVVVTGKILQSDGEKLKLMIAARDATGRKWFERNYETTAAELSYTDRGSSGIDPFQDLYSKVANDLLAERRKLKSAQTLEIQRVADLRFATDLAPARFDGYLKQDSKGRYSVARLPPESDPIVKRVADIRERDDLLVDTLDAHYAAFRQTMQPAYQEWRKSSYNEVIAERELSRQALGRTVLGAVAVVAGVVGMATANNQGTAAAGSLGVGAGVFMIQSGLSKGAEAKLHSEAIKELNQSINDDVAPRVVELEGKTVTLNGSAQEQYDQWRKLLHERYATEIGAAP